MFGPVGRLSDADQIICAASPCGIRFARVVVCKTLILGCGQFSHFVPVFF
jgi:hypothetical protein